MDRYAATGPSVPARWWGPATTVANGDVMNQLCRVCAEPAAGFHFGAFTCEGCKSFFGRTYNNLNAVSECKNNGKCVIDKKNRTSCKACRLRKCLVVGMSRSGSRYGRRSNWFKIHCLLQEQQQHQIHHKQHNAIVTTTATTSSPSSRPCQYTQSAAIAPLEGAKSELPSLSSSHGLNSLSGFWATQPTALTVPHQHVLPYFLSPFLPNPLQSVSHNYLLPFLPIRPPVPSPPSQQLPLHPLVESPTPLLPTLNEDPPAEELRSLPPVQDRPMDLSSSKKVTKISSPSLERRESMVERRMPAVCEDSMAQRGAHQSENSTPLDLCYLKT